MQAVLIAMTILGCNDSVTQCNYVATVGKHFETVAMCDADSERQLKHYSNISYPTVIAVCEPPHPRCRPSLRWSPQRQRLPSPRKSRRPGFPVSRPEWRQRYARTFPLAIR